MININKMRLRRYFFILENENGSAIVIALIILAALTIIGIASSNFSITELLISANDTVKKISFFNSDAGIFATPKVISQSINEKQTPISLSPPFTFPSVGNNDEQAGDYTLFRKLSGFDNDDPHDSAADIIFQNDGLHNTGIDIERLGSFSLVGGGAEFGTGAEGHAASLKGIRFRLDSTGRGEKNAETIIEARYLKVIGTAGGL